jgi:hypothetical protein
MVADPPGTADRVARATGSDSDHILVDIMDLIVMLIAGTAAPPATGEVHGDTAGIRPITVVCPTAPGNHDASLVPCGLAI